METNTVLLCHTGGKYLTRGKKYPVVKETGYTYTVRDDYFNIHSFSKNPDPDIGLSYKDWFQIYNEDETETESETESESESNEAEAELVTFPSPSPSPSPSNSMIIEKDERTLEEQVFELGCEVSMLTELVSQLIGELRNKGIDVSDTIRIEEREDIE